MEATPKPIPEGSILVHIGPPKTATTQLQASLYAARPELREQGVRHAGSSRHPSAAVHAALGKQAAHIGGVVPPVSRWTDLVRGMHAAKQARVVVSSEFFADASDDDVRRVVGDMGIDRVQVLVTLRPLARILPSQWMQYVCDGAVTDWDHWLRAIFGDGGRTVNPGFWRRHRHHELVARWAAVVGPERTHVLVLSEADRDRLLRDTEALLDLRAGTLREQEGLGNRSLTWPEVEAVRRFNQRVRADGMSRTELHRIVHYGASRYMKDRQPPAGAPRIELPDWVLPVIREEAQANVERIGASGVQVLGDLGGLAAVPAPSGRPLPDPAGDPVVAATFAVGVLIASGMARPGTGHPDEALAMVPTNSLAKHVRYRLTAAVRRRASRVRRLIVARR